MDLLLKEKAAALRSGGGRGGEGHAPEGAADHAQDRVDALVHKAMVHQVHVVGEGVIGQAALTGAHRWILHDNLDECGEADEVLLEMKDQFCAGIHLFLIHGLDHLLRLASIQTVIHPNIGSLDCRVTLFFLAALQVIRRGHWNFYRLENEYLNNAGKFRSVKVIPLPFHEVEEDLIVWMWTAALPTFRKLYGRIYVDLKENDTITVRLSNNYNTYNFGGKKKLVLSTAVNLLDLVPCEEVEL